MWWDILQDAVFSAVAAIGFAAISRPPRSAYVWCALIAAVGHSLRYILMNVGPLHLNIIAATLVASFVVGTCAVAASTRARCPAETCLFPALLPMIPGVYAYKAFGGLALCLLSDTPETYNYHQYLFASNAMTCCAILLCMVVGATIPIFLFKNTSFQATR